MCSFQCAARHTTWPHVRPTPYAPDSLSTPDPSHHTRTQLAAEPGWRGIPEPDEYAADEYYIPVLEDDALLQYGEPSMIAGVRALIRITCQECAPATRASSSSTSQHAS